MPADYSEDSLIEQPAITLFAELGWQTVNCFHERFGANGAPGRERSALNAVQANRNVCRLLNDGLRGSIAKSGALC